MPARIDARDDRTHRTRGGPRRVGHRVRASHHHRVRHHERSHQRRREPLEQPHGVRLGGGERRRRRRTAGSPTACTSPPPAVPSSRCSSASRCSACRVDRSCRVCPCACRCSGSSGCPPSGAVGVALNVTAVNPAGPGWLRVWPCGSPEPSTSSVNYLARGAIEPNAVVVPVDDTGEVCVSTLTSTEVLVDVSGLVRRRAALGHRPPARHTRRRVVAHPATGRTAARAGAGAVRRARRRFGRRGRAERHGGRHRRPRVAAGVAVRRAGATDVVGELHDRAARSSRTRWWSPSTPPARCACRRWSARRWSSTCRAGSTPACSSASGRIVDTRDDGPVRTVAPGAPLRVPVTGAVRRARRRLGGRRVAERHGGRHRRPRLAAGLAVQFPRAGDVVGELPARAVRSSRTPSWCRSTRAVRCACRRCVDTEVIVDVTGWFDAGLQSGAGRVVDTRTGLGPIPGR